ncbi:MAG: c-type cytochrome domain-containing protein [Steroidobacteraceae bacterium]
MKTRGRLGLAAMTLTAIAAPSMVLEAQTATRYEDIAPILASRCVLCHAGDGAPLGLRLDSVDGLLKGSARSPVVKAGDTAGSELIKRLKGTSQPRMPMTGPPFLTDAEIALFESWVNGGLQKGEAAAPAPGQAALAMPPRPRTGEAVDYRHVAPIFATRCAKCHTENGLVGPAPEGFLLTSYESTLSAADRLRVVPGRPNASELLRRIRGQAQPRMPMDGPPYLTEEEIGLIEAWIAAGARNAEGQRAEIPSGAKVRLHGTLEARWRLESLNLDVGGNTRIDKSPDAGDYVEVRGRLDQNGDVIVERVRTR